MKRKKRQMKKTITASGLGFSSTISVQVTAIDSPLTPVHIPGKGESFMRRRKNSSCAI